MSKLGRTLEFFAKWRPAPKTPKQTLETVDAEELRRERIRIEQQETLIGRAIEELEQKKEEFFRKGVECGSDRQKVQIARKIKELDSEIQARDKQLALISKNLRVINGLAQLKENRRILQDLGMDGLISMMDLEELQAYVEDATIEGQFQMERFTGLLNSLDDAESVYGVPSEDEDTLAIVEAMNEAASAGTDSAISDELRQLDETLHAAAAERLAPPESL
jgi:vacuolar-type H+-ATPase subunit I/STV1